jgi:DNA-binding PadR family transcriptional regulator
MPQGPRISRQTLQVLEDFLRQPSEWRYGYDLSRETGLKSGTLYPLLIRLAEEKWLETKWEEPERPGRPPRHVYRLTAKGLRATREVVAARRTRPALERPAFEAGRR